MQPLQGKMPSLIILPAVKLIMQFSVWKGTRQLMKKTVARQAWLYGLMLNYIIV
jgi:hypothetical protein